MLVQSLLESMAQIRPLYITVEGFLTVLIVIKKQTMHCVSAPIHVNSKLASFFLTQILTFYPFNLVIVGYGQEDITNEIGETETIRYWIARNSWGETWGENGFIRVKRGSGVKGEPGVCGIARSPSVALGGVYRQNRTDPLVVRDKGWDSKYGPARYRNGKYIDSFDSSASLMDHPVCDSMFIGRTHLRNGCMNFVK